jgi:hypothetical protein
VDEAHFTKRSTATLEFRVHSRLDVSCVARIDYLVRDVSAVLHLSRYRRLHSASKIYVAVPERLSVLSELRGQSRMGALYHPLVR